MPIRNRKISENMLIKLKTLDIYVKARVYFILFYLSYQRNN